jgi:hypothetical protein
MNERIFTELYKKAWGHFPCPTGEPELEKFAELIVAECTEQVEQAKNSPFVSLDDAKRMSHFVDVTKKRIEKHFRS